MDAKREHALRRDLQFARATPSRAADVPLILAQLGESAEPTNRGGATADRGAAKPRKAAKPAPKASADE